MLLGIAKATRTWRHSRWLGLRSYAYTYKVMTCRTASMYGTYSISFSHFCPKTVNMSSGPSSVSADLNSIMMACVVTRMVVHSSAQPLSNNGPQLGVHKVRNRRSHGDGSEQYSSKSKVLDPSLIPNG